MSCGELVLVILWAMLCSLITGVTCYYLGKLSYKKEPKKKPLLPSETKLLLGKIFAGTLFVLIVVVFPASVGIIAGWYLSPITFWEKLVTLLFSVLVGIITFIVIVVILEAVVSG